MSILSPGRMAPPTVAETLAARFRRVRDFSGQLCAPLAIEDYVVQSMPDASPAKWHLAHTTWFFETFVLEPYAAGYAAFNPLYRMLFNSYYDGVGPRPPRAERGLLTRPTVAEVRAYRQHVDEAMLGILDSGSGPGDSDGRWREITTRIELGLNHEQQHQELLLTDLQHALHKNPLLPLYRPAAARGLSADATAPESLPRSMFDDYPGGLASIGFDGDSFCYDNERPRHRVHVEPYRLASRLVTQAEYLAFMEDGGYSRPELWLADGFDRMGRESIRAPLYWQKAEDGYLRFSLHGLVPVDPAAPVCNISFYEADAFARWAGARLPTEAEWELACADRPVAGQFVEDGELVPRETGKPLGSVWQWTASPYVGYPGFRTSVGALGEYNGKFMADQWVLRGGSCFTPRESVRATYRNFFPASTRWQVSGIRLANS